MMLIILVMFISSTPSIVSMDAGGGCILDATGKEYAQFEAPVLRYQERFRETSSPVQGVHLSLAGPNQMRVTWMLPVPFQNNTFKPQCSFGNAPTSLSTTTPGKSYTYPDGMFNSTLNTVLLELGTMSNNMVYYKCGDTSFGFSLVYNFTLQNKPVSEDTKVRSQTLYFDSMMENVIDTSQPVIAVIGDHGVTHGEDTAASLAYHVKNDNVQLLVHAGDISYADKYGHNNSFVWVNYMNSLEPSTAFIPYMTTPGNHEAQYKFAAYLNWLAYSMPTSKSKSDFWYSFDYLGVHFVAFSTEHDFSGNSTQHKWMEQDLIAANANRKNSPWIIAFGHRPLYCTSIICTERCEKEAPEYRSYLEDLLYQQKVDVVFHGHNHQYERSYPVYKSQPVQKNYNNPQAPVYIVNGAAGNPEINDPTFRPEVAWRAFDDPTFETGYILMQATTTQLRFQYINSNKRKVVDQFIMSKQ